MTGPLMIRARHVALLLCLVPALALAQTPAAPAKPVRVEGTATPPARTAGSMPVYPDDARQRRIGGVVAVDVTIDARGKVTNATVVRSLPALAAAVTDAVRRWEYRMTPPAGNSSAAPALLTVVFYFDADTGRVDEVHRVPPLGPQPKKIKSVPPVYPASVRGARTGRVVLEAVVSRTGQVIDTRVVSGSGGFEAAAREAVRQWEYAPMVAAGVAVPFVVTVTVIMSAK